MIRKKKFIEPWPYIKRHLISAFAKLFNSFPSTNQRQVVEPQSSTSCLILLEYPGQASHKSISLTFVVSWNKKNKRSTGLPAGTYQRLLWYRPSAHGIVLQCASGRRCWLQLGVSLDNAGAYYDLPWLLWRNELNNSSNLSWMKLRISLFPESKL